jgi:hypothetical protein
MDWTRKVNPVGGFWFFLVFMLALIICAAIGIVVAWQRFGLHGLIFATACYFVFLILADIATSIIYFTYAKFEIKNRSAA